MGGGLGCARCIQGAWPLGIRRGPQWTSQRESPEQTSERNAKRRRRGTAMKSARESQQHARRTRLRTDTRVSLVSVRSLWVGARAKGHHSRLRETVWSWLDSGSLDRSEGMGGASGGTCSSKVRTRRSSALCETSLLRKATPSEGISSLFATLDISVVSTFSIFGCK